MASTPVTPGGIALSVAIPAYNEAARIGPTLDAARAYLERRGQPFELVVVDDGSSDDTTGVVEERARQAMAGGEGRIRLLRLGRNCGKGRAVREGVLRSRGRRVLFMDADLATPIEELAKLEAALDGGADVAIGSRALDGSRIEHHQHPIRETMGKTFNLLVRAIAISGIRDTQCGFKLFTRLAAETLFAEATIDRFAFDVELLLLARGRFRVVEVPVVWRHVDESKLSPVRDAARMAYDLAKLRAALLLHGGVRARPSPVTVEERPLSP